MSAENQKGRDPGVEEQLPPDGDLLAVAPWTRWPGWAGALIFGFLAVGAAIYGFREGTFPASLLLVAGWGFAAFLFGRTARTGLILSDNGVVSRTPWRTYRWSWDEIRQFQLGDREERPRFWIVLENGNKQSAPGFRTKSAKQENEAQSLCAGIQARLRREREASRDSASPIPSIGSPKGRKPDLPS